MNEKIEEDMKEKAAHEYRLLQARQRYQTALRCSVGGKHDWVSASTFSEVELFEIGASPDDTICRKCWGLRREYSVIEK